MTTAKTINLTRWTFVGKVISLLFNMLSRLAIMSPTLQVDSLPTKLSGKPKTICYHRLNEEIDMSIRMFSIKTDIRYIFKHIIKDHSSH